MYLEHLHLQNFRNLAEQSISFSPGFNYLVGPNGAGKTAVLEAIHLLARGRSFRTTKVAPLVAHGEQTLMVRAEVRGDLSGHHQLGISKSRSGTTQLRLDGQSQVRVSALAKHLPVQTLLPDAADLLLGGPAGRRAFMDWGLFHVEQGFLDASRAYRRVLMQRNAWLKSLLATGASAQHDDDPWLAQLEGLASRINEWRAEYVAQLDTHMSGMLASLLPGVKLELAYYWGGLVSVQESGKKMSESWPRDVKFGMTHRGPHRGDLQFTVDGQTAAETVSRGQAKLIASAALLAQAELLYRQSSTKSLFLIDDFGAELDVAHWQRFLRTLLQLNCQVIATSTEPWSAGAGSVQELADLRVFHVEQGALEVHN